METLAVVALFLLMLAIVLSLPLLTEFIEFVVGRKDRR